MAVELGSLRAELRIAGVFTHRERRTWIEGSKRIVHIDADSVQRPVRKP